MSVSQPHSPRDPPDISIAKTPALYVVATPLGNLGDISLRALETLRAVDAIAAEDTRHTARLLDHHGIRTRCFALHRHNEEAAAQQIVERLGRGESVALVSDAGTPAVSDPGARTVARVRAAGFRVVPVPGPNAAIAALSAAGIDAPHFLFCGFLPARSQARRSELERLRELPAALVFYEAPHRVLEAVGDLAQCLGAGREIAICRELTKLFEHLERLPLADAPAWLAADANRQRGEFVLIVTAPPAREDVPAEVQRLLDVLLEELPLAQAVKLAAQATGAPRKALYQWALAKKAGDEASV